MAEQKNRGGAFRSILVGLAAAAAVIGGVLRSCGRVAEEESPALHEVAQDAQDLTPTTETGSNAARKLEPVRPTRPLEIAAAPTPFRAAVTLGAASPAKPQTKPGVVSISCRLPVLSVLPDGSGDCSFIAFSYTRDPANRSPLSIAIAEDTPGGAGESTRACVWLAAMVAGLERSDDLSGARIVLDLPGRVDGPSAGGVICLAILAAMDGRELPGGFAMTGTIMPDGTVGLVGGVAAKIRGAARKGVRRVLVPAYLRFEQDEQGGREADLKELCQSLGLEFIPVEDVAQAYRLTFGGDATPAAIADRNNLDVPPAVEQLLKKTYTDDVAAGQKIWDTIFEDQRRQIQQNELASGLCVRLREKAEAGYHAGRLLYASEQAERWRRVLEAREQNVATFGALDGVDVKANVGKTDAKLQEVIQQLPDPMDLLLQARPKLSDVGLQLCGNWYQTTERLGLIGEFQAALDAAVAELDKPENEEAAKRQELVERIYAIRGFQLIYANLMLSGLGHAAEDAEALAATLPILPMRADPQGVERLFASAYQAAQNSFEKDVVRTGAADLQVSDQQALSAMVNRDESLRMYEPYAAVLQGLDQDAARHQGAEERRRIAAALAYVYANGLSRVSGAITRWSALDLSLDTTGNIVYRRTDLLNYLLERARANAMACIARCQHQGIPCPAPIADFEKAEFERDDNKSDKVDVLSDYWNASLQAKVLLMLFGPGFKS
jgi:hypothetical protein